MTDGQPKCLVLAHALHAARPIIISESMCSTIHSQASPPQCSTFFLVIIIINLMISLVVSVAVYLGVDWPQVSTH